MTGNPGPHRRLAAGWLASGLMLAAAGSALAKDIAPRERFDGAVVPMAIHAGPFELAWGPHVQRVKDLYGIDLELIGIPVTELFDKEVLELSTGTGAYCLMQINPGWMGDYVDYLLPLDDYMERWDPAWEDVHEGFRVWENTYEGKRYSLTMDGDIILGYYRKDLFEDPDEQAAFQAEYGYDLAPPATWDQLTDINAFFTRDRDNDGRLDMWGYADQAKRGRSFYWFLLRYIGFSSPDPQYFEPETMTPLINSAAGVAALEHYIATVEAGPPGVLGWEWDELFTAFMQGNIAMSLHWPDEGLNKQVLLSNVPEARMGYFLPPGVEQDGQLYRRSMTFGGWILGLAKDCPDPEAAYTVMWHMLSPEVSTLLVMTPGGGTDMFRQSQFDSPVIGLLADPDYISTYSESIAINFPELRIPGGFEYYDTLDVYVQKALAGEMSAQEALDAAAAAWDLITERFGREEQKEKYAAAMGLKG
jgi:multiple sugar transport system substrate-binding protein